MKEEKVKQEGREGKKIMKRGWNKKEEMIKHEGRDDKT